MQGITYGERRMLENIAKGLRPDHGLNPKEAHIDYNNLLRENLVAEDSTNGNITLTATGRGMID